MVTQKGLTLTEIAPGVDLERNVLAKMGFIPAIADNLKEMDPRLFRDQLMGLTFGTSAITATSIPSALSARSSV
jgi:propionate CoA-transferase